jgi:hypothetical protein
MTTKEKAAKIRKLTRQIAELEAKLGGLREELAKLQLAPGEVAPQTGLDLLWDAALPKSRERSTRQQCRVEWHRLTVGVRPKIEDAVAALKAWNKSEQWSKNGGEFAPGLHIFIKNRKWEDLPQVRDPIARYRSTPKPAAPAPAANPDEYASEDDIREILGGLTRKVADPDSSTDH